MSLNGQQIIGNQFSAKGSNKFSAFNPGNGAQLAPEFPEATSEEIDKALLKADTAFEAFQEVARSRRSEFLQTIGEEIVSLGDELIHRAMAETGLPEARIIGERGRTVNQLNMFADIVKTGDFLEISIDTALPGRTPIPRPDIRMINIPIGPVAVFGASNFPLAFSVAGGDTASALAAGCPVIVKAHPAHPGTSELVGMAIKQAAEKTGMPDGVFSMLHGKSIAVGEALVKHPLTRAVAFTGSFHGGMALFNQANSRKEPIPCFAEMGSINPVFLLPERLKDQAENIAQQYVDSLTLGVGQFCTNPGIVFGIKSNELDAFIAHASEKIQANQGGIMLHAGIKTNYEKSVASVNAQENVESIAKGKGDGETIGTAHLLKTVGVSFIHNPKMQEEMFGPASIIVECEDEEALNKAARALRGNLTATIQANESELSNYSTLIRILERKVGRILVNGFPTGVEVCHSMVHGGPYPATTDSRFSSVGAISIKRFLRPVCYQNFPESLLREEMQMNTEVNIRQKIDGRY
jgi:NADP-dependent aldehyde dehydrogenase